MDDLRKFSPSTARNRDPIFQVLRPLLPPAGTVLEIASGSGEHVVDFALKCPHLTFQPTDPSDEALESIAGWIDATGVANVLKPVRLDVTEPDWPVPAPVLITCFNMIHIAPWTACQGLVAGAGRLLARAPASTGGTLFLYGPFIRSGIETAPGNLAFDRDLRLRNPDWGIRHLDAVARLAADAGFGGPETTEMPANNLCVRFCRQ